MSVSLNQLVSYYANHSFLFSDSFITSLDVNSYDGNRYTAPNCFGFVIPIDGKVEFSLNNETYILEKGNILHAGPSMRLHLKTLGETQWKYAVVHYRASNEIVKTLNQHFLIPVGEHSKEMDVLLQQLLHYDKIPGALMRIKCKALFHQLLETILSLAKMHTYFEERDEVQYAITYLSENYQHDIAISKLSEIVGCDRRRLSYLFEKQYGLSPIQFLTKLRLNHAKELLRTTSLSISDIGKHSGYPDPFYFSRVFKKNLQMTPSEYRKQFFK